MIQLDCWAANTKPELRIMSIIIEIKPRNRPLTIDGQTSNNEVSLIIRNK